MYYFLSLLTGVLISVMIAVNGGLAEQYDVYSATVIIHMTGLAVISVFMTVKREWRLLKKQAWVWYTGGAIGVATIVFNNLAFGRISVSAILALGLLGQSVASLFIDRYGWMGMPKHPFHKQKLIGLLLILCGIASMINNFEILAVFVSFLAGIIVVVSRTLNAKLADLTSIRISTFFNYLIGFVLSIPVCFLLGGGEAGFTNLTVSPHLYIYLGGAMGVCVVLLSNMTVMKISAFYLSAILFIGQVFSGVLIDAVISQAFSPQNVIGGTMVTVGLFVNLMIDRKATQEVGIEP